MRVVVLGARGMLGHMAVTVLEEAGHQVTGICRAGVVGGASRHLDLEDRDALRAALMEAGPEWVVNAAGRLNQAVDRAPAASIYVNSYLPHLLANWGQEIGFRLLHVSTDCVFEGTRGLYQVNDEPDATSAYGRSKALGEVVNDRDLTIRTSIVGPELATSGTGLLLWFMRQSGQVPGWTKAIWSGLTTLEMARVIEAVVDGRIKAIGLWQCTPTQPIAKYDLLRLMNEELRGGQAIVRPVDGVVGNKSLVNDRPALWPVPDYRTMLRDLHAWMIDHAALYAGTPFAR